ncbi:hypothetical protein CK203_060223 [Vitis vinifera]|uniref:Endonuclease/exonuclease/phosphatase domain-containing protein n=1 Tax=Vitis vinifera TaxID=29760 RepID=A0A438FS30_VITVI|nr:hypothetical protein CK203_060223 [Vitis vinifera]
MEELDWLMEHLKKAVEVEASREFVTKRKPLFLVVPEGVKGKGWEDLRKAILSVQEYSERDGGASKEKNGDIRMNRDTFRGGGKTFSERKDDSTKEMVAKENMVVQGKFRRGWLVLKGLPFHLWDEVQLNFILKKWGRVTKVAKETLKLVDLTRAKLWVEMLPNVVLPALLEVEDGEWSYTVAVSVTGEDEDATLSPHKVSPKWDEASWASRWPRAPQAHQSASASSLSPQRAASSTKAIATLCPDVQGPAEVFFGEEGRAVELKAQSLPNLGHCQTTPWAPPRFTREMLRRKETAISKKTWSTLFPPSRSTTGTSVCSEPIFTRGSSSSSEDRNMEEEFGMGFQMERGIRVNPLSRCPLSSNLSKEDTSASRVEVKGGLTGRVGFDPRGYSDMGSPSNSIIRGKGLIFEGFCEIPGAKNLEVCQPSPSQPPESPSFPSCSPDSPLRIPLEENQCALSNQMIRECTPKDLLSGRIRRIRVISLLMVCPPGKWPKCERYYALLTLRCILGGNRGPTGIETCWFWLGRLGSLCFPMKIISWNVRGLGSRNKRRMVKDFLRSENPDVVMIQETKKENCDRRFVGSVWTVRNKDWVALPASGASGGILIIWDSKNLRREEVVIGSFSSQSSSLWTVVDLFGFLLFMVQTVPHLGRIFGWNFLTFMD